MDGLNSLLTEIGISKVRLAKYLGISRQMLYNYLAKDELSEWPKEKQRKLFNLLNIKDESEISSLKIDIEYVNAIDNELNEGVKEAVAKDLYSELKSFNKKEQELLTSIIGLLTERMANDKSKDIYNSYKYLYNFLQAMDSMKELKYILAYISKSLGMTEPLEFLFHENQQYIFESILYSAMTLYSSGGASRSRISETHKRFEKDIEQKKEEKLSRTQELNTAKIQALRELGYTSITEENAKIVLDKIAEIQSRKIV